MNEHINIDNNIINIDNNTINTDVLVNDIPSVTHIDPITHTHILNNNKCDTYCICRCCMYLLYIFCILLICALIYVFPIIQIIYANMYHDSVCYTRMNLSISGWLYTNGMFEIIVSTAYLVSKILYCNTFSKFLLFSGQLFTFIWLIIGSVLYFRDCSDIKPHSLNDLMISTIIIKWTMFIIYLCFIKLLN
jgi:hypothetical protein